MRKRLFTRHRHAVVMSRRALKFLAWLGAPVLTFTLVYQLVGGGAVAPVLAIGLVLGALIYAGCVLRLHGLTGEWRFL